MISKLIQTLLDKQLTDTSSMPAMLEEALHQVMAGDADPAAIGGLLIALASRPVDAATLTAAARVLRIHSRIIEPTVRPLIDTCGTGGDGANTFNISTTTAFVLAAAGCAVAKHGNRGVSSNVGSADVLEAAGCALNLEPQVACNLLDSTGFTFLFAQQFHPAMKRVAPIRRALGVRTIFNLLGPLTNPASAEFQLLGVFDPSLTEPMATCLSKLGSRGALVVHCGGLDEMGLHAPTVGHELRNGIVKPFHLDPADHGLAPTPIKALVGGDAALNLAHMRGVLGGEPGPRADVVALNSAAALMVAQRVASIDEGLAAARELLSKGSALKSLDNFAASSTRLFGETVAS